MSLLLQQSSYEASSRSLSSSNVLEHGGMPRQQQQQHASPPFHVLFTLLGRSDNEQAAQAIYKAWQVALKALLLNAPTDRPLHVHVLCNTHAQQTVDSILREHDIVHNPNSKWRQPINIQTYNVEPFHESWKAFLQHHLRTTELDERVSLGGYYRLLAHQVLNLERIDKSYPSIRSILYMDSDVVILANLNDLIPHIQTNSTTILFQGAKSWFCSGFTVLNLPAFDNLFWKLLDSIEEPIPSVGDQAIMTWILQHFSEHVTDLPPTWQRNLAHGWRHRPHGLYDDTTAAGMLHFQGGASRKAHRAYFDLTATAAAQQESWLTQYCTRSKQCMKNIKENMPKIDQTWGLASYYIHVPWKWVLYFGRSMIEAGHEGFSVQYETWTAVLGDEDSVYTKPKLVPSLLMTTMAMAS
jgi:hypothetical protein